MSGLYIALVPFLALIFSKKIKEIHRSWKVKDTAKLKMDLFFLVLMLLICLLIVFVLMN